MKIKASLDDKINYVGWEILPKKGTCIDDLFGVYLLNDTNTQETYGSFYVRFEYSYRKVLVKLDPNLTVDELANKIMSYIVRLSLDGYKIANRRDFYIKYFKGNWMVYIDQDPFDKHVTVVNRNTARTLIDVDIKCIDQLFDFICTTLLKPVPEPIIYSGNWIPVAPI